MPKPVQQLGTLAIVVVDGTCAITIDGKNVGTTNRFSQQIAAGVHTVGRKPATGALQTKQATVATGSVSNVTFQLANPGNSKANLPVKIGPPVGRPTVK